MTKTQNLYAEEVILESPFYYDENGRLRVRVLEESAPMRRKTDFEIVPASRAAAKPMKGKSASAPEEPSGELPEPKKMEKKPLEPVAAKPVKDVQKTNGSNDTPSIGRPVLPKTGPVRGGAAFGPKPIPGIKPLPSLPTNGLGNMRTADMQDKNLDGTDDRDQEQTPVKRPTAPAKKAFKSFRLAQKGPGRNVNTRAGLRGAKPAAKVPASRAAAKPIRGKSASYLEEKMNLKRAEMGEVIKDFQASDAPQFQGKSKAKRRMMAIAAKLEADRG